MLKVNYFYLQQKFSGDELDKIETNLKQLMLDVVLELGGTNDTLLSTDIENLIDFEKTLADVNLNFIFILSYFLYEFFNYSISTRTKSLSDLRSLKKFQDS